MSLSSCEGIDCVSSGLDPSLEPQQHSFKYICVVSIGLTVGTVRFSYVAARITEAEDPRYGVLSRLATVTVPFANKTAALHVVTAFAVLPSTKILHAGGVGPGDNDVGIQLTRLLPMQSLVTDLSSRNIMCHCIVVLRLLDSCCPPKLRVHDPSILSRTSDLPCRTSALQALSSQGSGCWEYFRRPAGVGTLERILLRDHNTSTLDYGDFFKYFDVLKEVDIELSAISTRFEIADDVPHKTRIALLIPNSVKKVVLRYRDEQGKSGFNAVVDELCKRNYSHQPKHKGHFFNHL